MRAGMVCLVAALLLVPAAPAMAQQKKPPPKEKPLPEVTRDGAIEQGKYVTRYWAVNHEQPSVLAKELQPYLDDVDFDAKQQSKNSATRLRLITDCVRKVKSAIAASPVTWSLSSRASSSACPRRSSTARCNPKLTIRANQSGVTR